MNLFKWFKREKELTFNIEDSEPAPIKRDIKIERTGNYRIATHIVGTKYKYSLEAEVINQTLENDIIIESGKNWHMVHENNICYVSSIINKYKLEPLYFDTELEAIEFKNLICKLPQYKYLDNE